MSDNTPKYDVVIRNGMIVDGARNPRYKGDIGVRDGVITRMGRIQPGQLHSELYRTKATCEMLTAILSCIDSLVFENRRK